METIEQLQARHRKEQRDCKSRVTQKKKAASKKTRKGVNTECEELERQLKEQQEREIAAFSGDTVPDVEDVPDLDDGLDDKNGEAVATNGTPSELSKSSQNVTISEPAESEDGQPRKRNRQKERLARRAAEQEAAAVEAEKEAAKLPNWKRMERTSMLKAFKDNGLKEQEIQPDGHCLFSAVADQLSQAGIPLGAESEAEVKDGQRYKAVRKAAAHYIEGHPDQFAGFMDEPLDQYVNKIRDTAEWGGQLELMALARSYNVEICVLQEGRMERIEPDTSNKKELDKVWLAYYRHGYGLGEHYNSLRKTP